MPLTTSLEIATKAMQERIAKESYTPKELKMEQIHYLKTWSEFFRGIKSGAKTFELRKNDRGFKVGDRLMLQEWLPNLEKYTGEAELRKVTYVLEGGKFGLEEGYCILGIAEVTEGRF
ncbi:ASCH/PUA domain-containing protein [Nibribacter koreensis]|uniref:DUF3850 domain-containing protein n=1 Tax=Nibribacter koreensis TaxID=1084519 RepID=A0ABP8FB57_9BACT